MQCFLTASVVLWYVWDNPLISGHQWLWCCFSYKKLKHLKLWVCSNWFRYINIRKTYLLVVTNKFQQLLSSSGAGFDKYTLNAVYPFFFFFPLHQYFQAICDNWCANLTFKGTNICYSISTWNTFKLYKLQLKELILLNKITTQRPNLSQEKLCNACFVLVWKILVHNKLRREICIMSVHPLIMLSG